MKKFGKKESRSMDEEAPKKYGVDVSRMMENAGFQIADFIRKELETEKIRFYIGKGNNGGDGMVAARRLHSWGFEVEVNLITKELNGIRYEELEILEKNNLLNKDFEGKPDLVVDGLIGYNLNGAPKRPFKTKINSINESEAEVLSIDLPTGLDIDKKEVLNPSVVPDIILSLGFPKRGLGKFDADKWVLDISMPLELYREHGVDTPIFNEKSKLKLSQI